MSLLERIIVAHRCRSTHHYIAMDALARIGGPDAEKWRNLILVHNEELLAGAKAPDAVFKDFKNHVLHVGEGEWGGARDAAMAWYGEAVAHLQDKKWGKAVYALGVMSHYYADPIQPFHTGQTEEEGAIHRAVEWSIAKSRDTIMARIEETGYPTVEAGTGAGFVSEMVRAGAEKSHPHYHTLIDHYDIHVGAKNPPAGLDQTLIDIIAELVAYATAGLAVIFERAFAEAGVKAPNVHITVPGYLATLDIPVRWVARKLDNAADKKTVTAMYKELQKTGKVVRTLPDDDKAIRKAHARQVLRRPLKELDAQELKPLGTKHEPRPEFAEVRAAAHAAEETRKAERVEKTAAKAKPEKVKKTKPEKARAKEVQTEQTTPEPAKAEKAPKAKKANKDKAAVKPVVRVVADKKAPEEAAPVFEPEVAAKTPNVETDTREQTEREEARREVARRQNERRDAEAAAEKAAQEAVSREAAEEDRVAAEKARREAEEFAELERLEAEEKARIEAEEAEELARMEAEEAAELARLEAEAEEAVRLHISDEDAYSDVDVDLGTDADDAAELAAAAALDAETSAEFAEAELETAREIEAEEEEFTLEELAAFETNLTGNDEAPPVDSFFEDGTEEASGRSARHRTLALDAPVIDAPSIGKKTARRLNRVGITTVKDLLECDVEEIAFEIDVSHITEETVFDWQCQTRLMVEVPGLRVHDAQVLVGAGVRSAEQLAETPSADLFKASMGFLSSSAASFIAQHNYELAEDKVEDWVGRAKDVQAA